MSDKKNIWQNPAMAAAGIATIVSGLANYLNLDADTMKLISTISPPLSILLSYTCIWILAKFFAFSITETKALTRLNKREKIIQKELKKPDLPSKTKKKLENELDEIVMAKSQIGKENSTIETQ